MESDRSWSWRSQSANSGGIRRRVFFNDGHSLEFDVNDDTNEDSCACACVHACGACVVRKICERGESCGYTG